VGGWGGGVYREGEVCISLIVPRVAGVLCRVHLVFVFLSQADPDFGFLYFFGLSTIVGSSYSSSDPPFLLPVGVLSSTEISCLGGVISERSILVSFFLSSVSGSTSVPISSRLSVLQFVSVVLSVTAHFWVLGQMCGRAADSAALFWVQKSRS